MDWLPILALIATTFFLIPILKDFQKKLAAIDKKITEIEGQVLVLEETIERDKEHEVEVNAELEVAKKESADIEKETKELKRKIEMVQG